MEKCLCYVSIAITKLSEFLRIYGKLNVHEKIYETPEIQDIHYNI